MMINNTDGQVDVWDAKGSPDAQVFSKDSYWLSNPAVEANHNFRLTGDEQVDWITYAIKKYCNSSETSNRRVLSIGCGNGYLERKLWEMGVFSTCDAFDYSPASIARARKEAEKAAIPAINYYVDDGNTAMLHQQSYDLVIFSMSLHHINDMEHLLGQVANSLKPGGLIIANEYVGPNRFEFTKRQKEVMDAMISLIPREYRLSVNDHFKGTGEYPTPLEVIKDDPSESIRSEEIPRLLNEVFEVVETRRGSGTTLQFLLNGIAGNFRPDNPRSMQVLNMLLMIENTLLDIHDLNADFMLIIGRNRAPKVELNTHSKT
ncbi:class I SAM-dependent methyltransferase [Phragmitibacter flavus]|uniref:Class I SAM-dependent methyltransferase n=1 Tax=Phragmitibacter flavus TaxID=2576071 RepID=A0A5R8KD89_9BACT|nr:class I SAM-dependent methyltransferase [Phragmitibacter flavus]TLD70207.1 class I SAM-dependent methyltransferase [Phragmitibacter flavus]